ANLRPATLQGRPGPSRGLSPTLPIKFALLSEDVMLHLTLRTAVEAMAQKCILESYLKRPEAFFFLNLTPPTLLFVDIHALADRGANNLRKLQIRHPKLLIVMLAEKSVPEQIVSALRAGASGYLISPVSPLQLNH